ncbi:cell death regulator Aven-like [Lineus longissimus]|uniref:cell death regulator Aven-like n=1 Tax=Lineus longissimus TaxID=88925 RepID=UPI002B4CD4A4
MRPDAHKKKKSAQYQKKNPQKVQGKTQASGKSEGGKKEKPGNPDKQYEQRLNRKEDDKKEKEKPAAAEAGDSDSSGSDSENNQPVRRTFRRRKVETNWEKYEEPEVDYSIVSKEEQLEQKQEEEDFQRHLTAKVKAHSPLRLQDEEDDDSHGYVVSVDSEELAEDFRKTLHSDDIRGEPSSDSKNLQTDEIRGDSSLDTQSLSESRDSITNSKSTSDLSGSAPVSEESKTDKERAEGICIDSELRNDGRLNSSDDKTVVDKDDDVLDFLLSLDTPVVTPVPKTEEAQKISGDENAANKSNNVNSSVGTRLVTRIGEKKPGAPKESIQDLEDWLDSVI